MPDSLTTNGVPPPTAVIIFGASGDLTQRKLVPALYTLAFEGRLPAHYAVIGVARSEFDTNGQALAFWAQLAHIMRE